MHPDATLPDNTGTLEHMVRALDRTAVPDGEVPGDGDDAAPVPRIREGLPKTYRSRHDRHYVEQLISTTGMPLLRMLAVSRIDAANLPEAADVAALTASVARLGVLQPLLVRAQGERFVLISGRKRLAAARAAHCREVPCLVHTADDVRAEEIAEAANAPAGEHRERALQAGAEAPRAECDPATEVMLPEIDHALSSVQRALRLLPGSPASTRERVAMRLMAAELERAQWLVRCRRYLAGRISFTPRQTAAADVVQDLRTLAPAIVLHGGALDVELAGSPAPAAVDSALLTAAVHGLAWALLALGETAADPRVRVTIAGGANGAWVVTTAQPTVALSGPVLLRFFETGWRSRPGGAAAELAVQLARYTAARHGAHLEISSAAGAGTAITLALGKVP